MDIQETERNKRIRDTVETLSLGNTELGVVLCKNMDPSVGRQDGVGIMRSRCRTLRELRSSGWRRRCVWRDSSGDWRQNMEYRDLFDTEWRWEMKYGVEQV